MKLTYIRSNDSIQGVLVAEFDGKTLYIKCSSGQPGFENTDFVRSKSPIPRGNHWLYTQKKNPKAPMPVKANEVGPSYSIGGATDPVVILGANNGRREYIELHFDQKLIKLRGSAGCPVINQDDKKDADTLSAKLDDLCKKGVEKVAIQVVMA